VFFGVTVGAQQPALLRFARDCVPLSVGQRTDIKLEVFLRRIRMMKLQCSVVAAVTAAFALRSLVSDQLQLALSPAALLRCIGLMSLVGIRVFASSRTKLPLKTP
jgi:hypothetical protein